MSMPTHDEILQTALGLPEAQRIMLATELLNSIAESPPGISTDDPGLEAELDRRFNDATKTIAWDEVRRQLDDDLKP